MDAGLDFHDDYIAAVGTNIDIVKMHYSLIITVCLICLLITA